MVAYLRERGHDIELAKDVLGPGAIDPLVAEYAERDGRIVATFNLRDYNRLIKRTDAAGRAGLIGFQCQQSRGLERLSHFVDAIEHEHGHLRQKDGVLDRRLIVQVTETILKILR